MEEFNKEQVKPLAPLKVATRSDEPGEALFDRSKPFYERRYIICCGVVIAFFLILAVTFIVLAFTIFHIRNPTITMKSARFIRWPKVANGSLMTDRNATLSFEVSVKNPNFASFKFGNATTVISYGSAVIGEGRSLAGKAPSRRTIQLNLTVDIITKDLASVPGIKEDLSKEELSISSYTRINGKVKILEVFKKSVLVKADCTMKYNISTHAFEDERCEKQV